ncbi:MAG: hypothetical protein IPL84_03970 [Chitinophagaceae bacterium]|nr:hypothetical protein [Chitinophagaceae bacterium]
MYLKNDIVELSQEGKEATLNALSQINKRLKNQPVNKELTRDAFKVADQVLKEIQAFTADRAISVQATQISFANHDERRKQLESLKILPNSKQLKS